MLAASERLSSMASALDIPRASALTSCHCSRSCLADASVRVSVPCRHRVPAMSLGKVR